MYWEDEGYLISKNNFDENSIIIEVFTLNYGKYSGIVYGGSSRKQKKIFQSGNKLFLNWKSKSENRNGYFTAELIEPIAPYFFEDKKKIACILSTTSILKILLPERETNKKIYKSLEYLFSDLKSSYWINSYINWELFLIKELGYEENLEKFFDDTKKALIFNKSLLMKNFIVPNKLKFPLFRNILESFFV